MKPNWNNMFAAGLGLTALIFGLRYREQAAAFLSTVNRIGPGNSPEDMTLGLIVIGLCGAVLVAIVRILASNHRND
jgi:hypothetical protein